MNNIIKFIARDEITWNLCDRPYPASQNIPQWWKDMSPYEKSHRNPDGNKLVVENYTSNASAKKCVPMLDALITGYLIPLWTDVSVTQIEDNPIPRITWRPRHKEVFSYHGNNHETITPPAGYKNVVFKFENGWIPKTPKGYSVLITTPLGHRNLPFYAVPAVLDSDKSTLDAGVPMWVKEGLEGVVEKGTPLVQVIPFKRDNWKAEFDYYKNGEYALTEDKNFRSTIVNHYMKNYWSKKEFK